MFIPKNYKWEDSKVPSFFECDECRTIFGGSNFPSYNGVLFRFCPSCSKPTGDYKYQERCEKTN